jgi:hypothetical protein
MPYLSPLLNEQQVCTLLKVTPGHFRQIRNQLEAEGFPPPDPVLGAWHRAQIEQWLERRAHPDCVAWFALLDGLQPAGGHDDALR